MKFSIRPVALAVTMALGVAIAQAQTLPSMSAGTPADPNSSGINTNDGLYLAVWDNTSKATELVDLTSVYSDVAIGTTQNGPSILTSPTVGSNGWTRDDQARLLEMVADGHLDPVVHAVRPLHAYREALQELMDGKVIGKSILEP